MLRINIFLLTLLINSCAFKSDDEFTAPVETYSSDSDVVNRNLNIETGEILFPKVNVAFSKEINLKKRGRKDTETPIEFHLVSSNLEACSHIDKAEFLFKYEYLIQTNEKSIASGKIRDKLSSINKDAESLVEFQRLFLDCQSAKNQEFLTFVNTADQNVTEYDLQANITLGFKRFEINSVVQKIQLSLGSLNIETGEITPGTSFNLGDENILSQKVIQDKRNDKINLKFTKIVEIEKSFFENLDFVNNIPVLYVPDYLFSRNGQNFKYSELAGEITSNHEVFYDLRNYRNVRAFIDKDKMLKHLYRGSIKIDKGKTFGVDGKALASNLPFYVEDDSKAQKVEILYLMNSNTRDYQGLTTVENITDLRKLSIDRAETINISFDMSAEIDRFTGRGQTHHGHCRVFACTERPRPGDRHVFNIFDLFKKKEPNTHYRSIASQICNYDDQRVAWTVIHPEIEASLNHDSSLIFNNTAINNQKIMCWPVNGKTRCFASMTDKNRVFSIDMHSSLKNERFNSGRQGRWGLGTYHPKTYCDDPYPPSTHHRYGINTLESESLKITTKDNLLIKGLL